MGDVTVQAFNAAAAANQTTPLPRTSQVTSSTPASVRAAHTVNARASLQEEAERDETLADVLAGLTKLGYTGVKEVDLGKLNPPDLYEDELEVMAEVRAYFDISCKVRLSCDPRPGVRFLGSTD